MWLESGFPNLNSGNPARFLPRTRARYICRNYSWALTFIKAHLVFFLWCHACPNIKIVILLLSSIYSAWFFYPLLWQEVCSDYFLMIIGFSKVVLSCIFNVTGYWPTLFPFRNASTSHCLNLIWAFYILWTLSLPIQLYTVWSQLHFFLITFLVLKGSCTTSWFWNPSILSHTPMSKCNQPPNNYDTKPNVTIYKCLHIVKGLQRLNKIFFHCKKQWECNRWNVWYTF